MKTNLIYTIGGAIALYFGYKYYQKKNAPLQIKKTTTAPLSGGGFGGSIGGSSTVTPEGTTIIVPPTILPVYDKPLIKPIVKPAFETVKEPVFVPTEPTPTKPIDSVRMPIAEPVLEPIKPDNIVLQAATSKVELMSFAGIN